MSCRKNYSAGKIRIKIRQAFDLGTIVQTIMNGQVNYFQMWAGDLTSTTLYKAKIYSDHDIKTYHYVKLFWIHYCTS